MLVRVLEKPKCMYIISKEGDLRNWLTGLGNYLVQIYRVVSPASWRPREKLQFKSEGSAVRIPSSSREVILLRP